MKNDQYQFVRGLATDHILKGRGVVPSDTVDDSDPIEAVAKAFFGADKADGRFDRSIAGLDRQLHEEVYLAAWELVWAYQDAAFTFGAAVGLQLLGLPVCSQGHDEPSGRR